LPQGGACAAPKRCPGCGWGVPGLQETFLSVLDRRSQSTHAGFQGPYTGRGSACSPACRGALPRKSPATGGAKDDRVRHLASPISPSMIKSQESKVFCLTPDSIRSIFL
jgi:hypothetical protein